MILAPADSRTGTRPKSFRWKAFGIHLALSLVILGALLYILFFHWFPGYLFDTDGGWQALRVIAGVDIILGPMLTLIAANPIKSDRELRMDFSVIGLIQICALSAGTWLAWDNRPYAMLWYDGVAYSMPWSAMRSETQALARLDTLSPEHPRRVSVALPFDPFARDQAFQEAEAIKTTPLFDGRLYRAWPPEPAALGEFSRLAREMSAEQERTVLDAALAKHPGSVLVPTRSRYATYYLLLDAASGELIDVVHTPPPVNLLNGLYPGQKLRDALAATAAGATSTAPAPASSQP